MTWMCACGAIEYDIQEDYQVEEERFYSLAESLGHTETECEPTT